jgi:hypothetical protein
MLASYCAATVTGNFQSFEFIVLLDAHDGIQVLCFVCFNLAKSANQRFMMLMCL